MKLIKALLWGALTLILTVLHFAFIGGALDPGTLENGILMFLLVGGFSLLHLLLLLLLNHFFFEKSVFTFKIFSWLKENGALYIVGGIVLGMILSLATATYAIFTHLYLTFLLITGKDGRRAPVKSNYKSPAPTPKPTPAPAVKSTPAPTSKPQAKPSTENIRTNFTARGLEVAVQYGLGNGNRYANGWSIPYCNSGKMTGLHVSVYEDRSEFKVNVTGKILVPLNKVEYTDRANEIGRTDMIDDEIKRAANRLSNQAADDISDAVLKIADRYCDEDGPAPKEIGAYAEISVEITV